jgi:hypothetical protein
MSSSCGFSLEAQDIKSIEHLLGKCLDVTLLDYLLANYGKGSFYSEQTKWANTAAKDCKGGARCDECCACLWLSQDSLFKQVVLTVLCFENGCFDAESQSYRDVREKLTLQWAIDDDPDCPF